MFTRALSNQGWTPQPFWLKGAEDSEASDEDSEASGTHHRREGHPEDLLRPHEHEGAFRRGRGEKGKPLRLRLEEQ